MDGQRKYNRHYSKSKLPGSLTRNGSLEKIQNIEITDISNRGLGVLSDIVIPKGCQLTLKLEGEEPLILEVIYCNKETGRIATKYSIGLFCRHESKSLTKLLLKHGIEVIATDQEKALAS